MPSDPKKRKHVIALLLFLTVWGLYALTAAPGTLFGDPSEYQFIPAIWGIAHPPGYAFYTLLAGLWQRLVPVGSVAFRTNLLAGAVGAWTVTRVFLIVLALLRRDEAETDSYSDGAVWLPALVAGFALAIAPDFWQHSIHANAHIVSVALTITQLWLLVRWSQEGRDGWLYAFAFFAGLGVTHHPITVFGFPAYTLFIIVKRPSILLQPKTLAAMVACGLLGLSPWLYFPLRSPTAPFGPTNMASWEGFLQHATAKGLRVNLFHFGLVDQLDRLRVFWTLLRLQYPWPLLAVIVVGGVVFVRRWPRVALLWGVFLLGHLGFTLNSVQDVMAYLLHAFAALAVVLGAGMAGVCAYVARWINRRMGARALESAATGGIATVPHTARKWAYGVGAVAMLLLAGAMLHTFPRISLRDWHDADMFIARLLSRFEGRGEGAAFISDWEHLTPYFYHTYVEDQPENPDDLRHVYVTARQPWAESTFGNLPLGPVYLSNYRREIRELGFRLRPEGDLWRVLEPPATAPVTPQYPLTDIWVDGRIALLGYDMPVTTVVQGRVLPVVLYAQVATTQTAILMPYARLDSIEQRWTTDSRRLIPEWRPGEIIGERYEVFIPYTLSPGRYTLRLGYADMSNQQSALPFSTGDVIIPLGEVQVVPGDLASREARVLTQALTNIGNDVALMSARMRAGFAMRRDRWEEPLMLKPGHAFHLTLTWRALASPRTSYTVFIHLIDAGGQLVLGHDYTPLGGAFPSYLWFPKWLEGQQVIDPYRLVLPPGTPPGQYWLEVGMYEMGSIRRIPQLGLDGTMTGDRFILGPVVVEP